MKLRSWGTALSLRILLVPALVILTIWLPVLAFHAVPAASVADATVAAARSEPSDAILREVGDFSLLTTSGRGPQPDVRMAEGILHGQLALPGLPAAEIDIPFSPDDLDGLPASLQLPFAGYVVPDILLAAYEDTQRVEFLTTARDVIVAWDRYEASALLPRGYLWNDHATSARVRVLAEFWRLYRESRDYRPDVGRVVLEQAARYGVFLSDPGNFTFATNHGLMENLALLQLRLAFPTLPDGPRYQQLAVQRLGQQLSFLVDGDGVVRENSAGYQSFGLGVLGMTFRCLTLLHVPVPAEWAQKYARGLAFLASLRRPDGSLPTSGDTDGESGVPAIRITDVDELGWSSPLRSWTPGGPAGSLTLDSAAGYWVEWDGLDGWPAQASLSQTVVTWTSPPAPSHKHADELSVLLWANGVSWLTSVGYWPYEATGRSDAESWRAANAPHLVDEPPVDARTAHLHAAASTPQLSALDLERRGPGTYVARRQVVHLKPDLWVIVDHVRGGTAAGNETVWTTAPEVTVQRQPGTTTYALEAPGQTAAARMTILGSNGTEVRDLRGRYAPFAGWQVIGSVPQPASAMMVQQPAGDAWTVVVLSTADHDSPRYYDGGPPTMSAGTTPDAWTVTVPTAAGGLEVTLAAGTLTVDEQDGGRDATSTVELAPEPDPTTQLAPILAAFEQTAAEYPVFQERASARTKVTLFLGGLLLVQELLLLLVGRWRRVLATPLRAVSLLGWVGVAAALHFLVLPSWQILTLN